MSQSRLILIQTHDSVSASRQPYSLSNPELILKRSGCGWDKVQGEGGWLLEAQLEWLRLKLISRLTIKRAHDSTAQTYYHRYVCPMCAEGWVSLHKGSTLTVYTSK